MLAPFTVGRLAGRRLWSRPLAPLMVALLLLGWELGLCELAAPLLGRLLRAAWAGRPLLPGGLALAATVLVWDALLAPIAGLGVAWVEAGAGAVPRAVGSLAGLAALGLVGGVAVAGAHAGLLAAAVAAAGRRLRGGGAVPSALLWALPAPPALLLGALASGAPLLGAARLGGGELEARTPVAGLRTLGLAAADLLRDPLRTGSVFSALLLITSPFGAAAVFLGTAALLTRGGLARAALLVGSALASSAALLWLAAGLRLALAPEIEAGVAPGYGLPASGTAPSFLKPEA